MENELGIIGAALGGSGVLSAVVGFLWKIAPKIARIEQQLKGLEDVPERLARLETKIAPIWDIMVTDALRVQMQRGFVQEKSAPSLTDKINELPLDPEIGRLLHELAQDDTIPKDSPDLEMALVERMGLPLIKERAKAFAWTLPEYLVTCALRVQDLRNHSQPEP